MKRHGLLIAGTSSSAGKSMVTTGIVRALSNAGIRVAPFKGQNMALNSYVTESGGEIGRAQASQAMAARVVPEVAMNPVLLKPTSHTSSSVVVMGQHSSELGALDYQARKAGLVEVVDAAYHDLASRFDAVVCEGAGSPAEINLLENDLVNLGFASRVQIPALLVGDIDRGGVFASLYGTKAILPSELSSRIRAFVINKFRGDGALLEPGIDRLISLTSVPVLGVIPYASGLESDSEDSLGLKELFSVHSGGSRSKDHLRVGVVALPYISNFTDFEPLIYEENLEVRLIFDPSGLHGCDLVIIPGTKATVADLDYLRKSGFAAEILAHIRQGQSVMGICGGYQMLTEEISDPIESQSGLVPGLAVIGSSTTFYRDKVLTQARGTVSVPGGRAEAHGYQIHFGRVPSLPGKALLENFTSTSVSDGASEGFLDGPIAGTTLHGIFDSDAARSAILGYFAARAGKTFVSTFNFASHREKYFERCAELVTTHIGLDPIYRLLGI